MSELQTVEVDGYDRDVFDQILHSEKALQAHQERLARLLPHPRALLLDLFAVLFKLNVMVRAPLEIQPSALVNRRLVEAVLGRPGIQELRQRTRLDTSETRHALVLLVDRMLRALLRRDINPAASLSEGMEAAEDETALTEAQKALEHLESGEFPIDPDVAKNLSKQIKNEIRDLSSKLKKARSQQTAHANALPLDLDNEISASVERMTSELGELDNQLRGLGLSHPNHPNAARRRLELGEKLAHSKKLRLVARLAGTLKDVALTNRKKKIPRAPQTVHAVTTGSDLAHLLPSELPGLNRRRRGVHLDFLRRFTEKRLMQYDLRSPASRGPMVVCVDGSGSMSGSKEIWAKAIGLTLMEIARRERRGCLAMVFSDSDQLFEVELLSARRHTGRRTAANDQSVLQFAEFFPGGGTNFEQPLGRALKAVTEGPYKNGDIIFITDGQAPISQSLVESLRAGKKSHRFKIRGILVDVDHNQVDHLSSVADDVIHIQELSEAAIGSFFSAV